MSLWKYMHGYTKVSNSRAINRAGHIRGTAAVEGWCDDQLCRKQGCVQAEAWSRQQADVIPFFGLLYPDQIIMCLRVVPSLLMNLCLTVKTEKLAKACRDYDDWPARGTGLSRAFSTAASRSSGEIQWRLVSSNAASLSSLAKFKTSWRRSCLRARAFFSSIYHDKKNKKGWALHCTANNFTTIPPSQILPHPLLLVGTELLLRSCCLLLLHLHFRASLSCVTRVRGRPARCKWRSPLFGTCMLTLTRHISKADHRF